MATPTNPYKVSGVKMPRVPKYRPKTPRDFEREAYKSAGVYDQLAKLRKRSTKIAVALRTFNMAERIAGALSKEQQNQLIALSTGLLPRTGALTVPERLAIAWSMASGYKFGGVYPDINTSADFFSQYPLNGGRAESGGAVADLFFTASATGTSMGVVLRVQGLYFHSGFKVEAKDNIQKSLLEGSGYIVQDIWDYETNDPGVLNQRMEFLVGKKTW